MAFIFPKLLNISALALAVYFYLFAAIGAAPVDNSKPKKKNIIFLVGDGFGPSGINLARNYKQYRDGLTQRDLLNLDGYLIGTQRTSSNSSYITDSAAAGSALATGKKTVNGYISVDPEKKAVGAIGEALKLQGYAVGIVVTTSVGDATPSVWVAHAESRSSQDLIVEQMVGQIHPLGPVPDLIIGGGRRWFYGIDEGGRRKDNRSLIEEVQNNGTWTYIGDRAGFDSFDEGKNATLPLLGLFAEDDYPYRIDREDSEYPNLVEQAQFALNALTEHTKDSEQGFFLMIESSRIDHAGHENCVQSHALEALEYDEVVGLVRNYTENADVDTIVVATADHETGGLVLNQDRPRDFSVVLNATHSGEYLAKEINNYEGDDLRGFIRSTIIEEGLGLTNYTDEEVERLARYVDASSEGILYTTSLGVEIANLTSFRSKTHWGSLQHTSVDVDLYGFSNAPYLQQKLLNVREGLAGFHENTDFSVFIKSITDIDLDEVTELIADIPTKY
ncbi:PHO8 Repressible alkaline phosphatase [Candida maltosa Xu316]|uniref:alkaline phosphatase n=1 Tax=Candida maltosa (strain Xu316) TaxID=1245528 RepID=M3HQC2_CANMX|nr:Alkaline phosphatase [Candida maltosa Xu316]